MSDHEESLRALAYRLWEEAGCPDGRSDEFWYTALEILTCETRPPETDAEAPEPPTAQQDQDPGPAPRT